jgi:cyclic pyranopterin phosphate synthase
MPQLSHTDEAGAARLVDVSAKPPTLRQAVAEGFIQMNAAAAAAIAANAIAKGDVVAAARIAGIMAAKATAQLIPLCHPLGLDHVVLAIEPEATAVRVRAEVATRGPTGVEMEALTAVSVALLTIYDMAKSIDRAMRIEGIRLLEKSGGRSGDWRAP